MDLPTISIIIPTLNSSRTLGECLDSILMQDYPREKIEIIIADGGSIDGTLEIINSKLSTINYKLFPNPLKTGEAGKAVGVKEAKNEIIALIDSDNILPQSDWLKRMVEPFQDSEIVASEPLYYTYRKTDPYITRYCALLGMNDPLCIEGKARVLSEDGYTTESIQNLKTHWPKFNVTTYNTNSKRVVASKILQFHNLPTNGRDIYELITESGKKIKATGNHPFYTPNGWKCLSGLKKGDWVATTSLLDEVSTKCKEYVIISEEMFKNTVCKLFPKTKGGPHIDFYIKYLREAGLMPLKSTNRYLPIIARLVGHLFSDGTLGTPVYVKRQGWQGRDIIFCAGSKNDAEAICRDLRHIGIGSLQIKEVIRTRKFKERSYTARCIVIRCSSVAYWVFFYLLGVPCGKKVEQGYLLPFWIEKGSRLVQREFLAGMWGGDGSKITISSGKRKIGNSLVHRIGGPNLIFFKLVKYKEEGYRFAEQLLILFSSFGIRARIRIDKKPRYTRKDGKRTIGVIICFGESYQNLYNFCKQIGYCYSRVKELTAKYAQSFISVRLEDREIRDALYQKVMGLRDRGYGSKKIAKIIKIPSRTIEEWINRGRQPRSAGYSILSFNEWLKNRVIGDGLIWEEVKLVQKSNLANVYNLGIALATQNYIANGFLVHNCLFLGNYDRYCSLTGKWTEMPHREEDKKKYLKVEFSDPARIPTIGANGFLIRRDAVLKHGMGDYLFDIDIVYDLAKTGIFKMAKVKTGIIHLYSNNILQFIKKQRRRVNDYLYYKSLNLRKYPWDKMNRLNIIKFCIYNLLVIPLFMQTWRSNLKKWDAAWLFHPIACITTLMVYGINILRGWLR